MTENFWTLALLLDLKARLDFFHSRTELNHLAVGETHTLGTLGVVLHVRPSLRKASHCQYTSSSHV